MYSNLGLEPVIEALINNQGLDAIAEKCAQVLKNPFWIVDMISNFIVPIYGDTKDERLIKESKDKYPTPETLDFVKDNRIREVTDDAKGSYLFHPLPDVSIINCPVKITGITVAFISVKEETTAFEPVVYDQMEVIANIIATELQKDSFYKENKYLMYSYFLSDLIQNQWTSEDIESRLSYLGYATKKYFYLLTMDLQNIENRSFILKSLQKQVNFILPGSIYCLYENHAVFLYTSDHILTQDCETAERLRRFLDQSHVYGAISDHYTNLTLTSRHYRKTLDALKIGIPANPSEHLFHYGALAVHHMFNIIEGLLTYRDFSDNAVGKLESYDIQNHAMLLETVYQYLIHNMSISGTAASMYVHQNTIRQRIEKAKEITGIPLENGFQVFELMLALRLYKKPDHHDVKDKNNLLR